MHGDGTARSAATRLTGTHAIGRNRGVVGIAVLAHLDEDQFGWNEYQRSTLKQQVLNRDYEEQSWT